PVQVPSDPDSVCPCTAEPDTAGNTVFAGAVEAAVTTAVWVLDAAALPAVFVQCRPGRERGRCAVVHPEDRPHAGSGDLDEVAGVARRPRVDDPSTDPEVLGRPTP